MPNWIAMLLLDKNVILILLCLRLHLLRSNPKKKKKKEKDFKQWMQWMGILNYTSSNHNNFHLIIIVHQ